MLAVAAVAVVSVVVVENTPERRMDRRYDKLLRTYVKKPLWGPDEAALQAACRLEFHTEATFDPLRHVRQRVAVPEKR